MTVARGKCERSGKAGQADQADWDDSLVMAEYAINDAVNASTYVFTTASFRVRIAGVHGAGGDSLKAARGHLAYGRVAVQPAGPQTLLRLPSSVGLFPARISPVHLNVQVWVFERGCAIRVVPGVTGTNEAPHVRGCGAHKTKAKGASAPRSKGRRVCHF